MEEEEGVLPDPAFGSLLRRYRIAAGLSQEALAELARMSTNGIGALERGERRTPQRETLSVLAQALGLDPDQRKAFAAAAARPRVLRTDDGRAACVPARSGADLPPRRRHNLPRSLARFVGRETELAEIGALLGVHQLVTLTGAGGIGKTSTALESATRLVDSIPDGVWFIELSPLRDAALIGATIARVLGVAKVAHTPPLETLAVVLKDRTALLIFDNCEHLIAAAAIAAHTLLQGCRKLRILATSREPLRIAGERTYRIPSLPVPLANAAGRLAAADAAAYGAIELFVDRTQGIDHRFTLHDENVAIVADICRRLDGIPLAIELAAARVKMLGPLQLRERLDERFDLLTGGRRDVLPRQQTLRALIEWSYDLLDDRERKLLRRLSVFASGFTLAGAIAVGGGDEFDEFDEFDVFDILSSLVDKSLVLAESGGDDLRYRMLESTRAYGREKLEAGGELQAAVSRHLRCMRGRFTAARARAERSGSSAEIDALLVTELDDVRVALDEGSGGERAAGAALLAAIDSRWLWVGLGGEGLARVERFAKSMPAREPALTSRLWSAFARIVVDTDAVRAVEAASTAVGLARDANNQEMLTHALAEYGTLLARGPGFEHAAAALADAERSAPAGNVRLNRRILDARAFLLHMLGDSDGAARIYEQVRLLNVQLRNESRADTAAINLGEVEYQRGQTERAVLALTGELLPALRARRDRVMLLNVLANLCEYLVALDRLAQARDIAREIFETGYESDRKGWLVPVAIELAALTVALDGDVANGAQLAGYTQAAFGRSGFLRQNTEQTTRTRLDTVLSAALAPAEQRTLFAAGAALSTEAAIAFALACFDRSGRPVLSPTEIPSAIAE